MGVCSGVYITQNYQVPQITFYVEKITEHLKSLEKNNRVKDKKF